MLTFVGSRGFAHEHNSLLYTSPYYYSNLPHKNHNYTTQLFWAIQCKVKGSE